MGIRFLATRCSSHPVDIWDLKPILCLRKMVVEQQTRHSESCGFESHVEQCFCPSDSQDEKRYKFAAVWCFPYFVLFIT